MTIFHIWNGYAKYPSSGLYKFKVRVSVSGWGSIESEIRTAGREASLQAPVSESQEDGLCSDQTYPCWGRVGIMSELVENDPEPHASYEPSNPCPSV